MLFDSTPLLARINCHASRRYEHEQQRAHNHGDGRAGTGDGYIFITAGPQRAIDKLEKWSAQFGAECVQGDEGFERLARPLMAIRDQDPSRGN